MQFLSLITGLTLAVIAFFAIGAWRGFEGRPEAPSLAAVARSANDGTQAGAASFTPSSSFVFVVVLVRSEAEVAAAEQKYVSGVPGWHTEVIVLATPESEQDFHIAFNSLMRHGGPGSYRMIDLLR